MNGSQNEMPVGEDAIVLYDLIATGQLFLGFDHDHVYVGECNGVKVRVDCREFYYSIDGKDKRMSQRDTGLICQEIAKQSGLQLARIKENNLRTLRKLAGGTN